MQHMQSTRLALHLQGERPGLVSVTTVSDRHNEQELQLKTASIKAMLMLVYDSDSIRGASLRLYQLLWHQSKHLACFAGPFAVALQILLDCVTYLT